jgi:hypothetical protein
MPPVLTVEAILLAGAIAADAGSSMLRIRESLASSRALEIRRS